MKRFIQRFGEKIIGILSGWDRLVIRGTLRRISYPGGMDGFLWHNRTPYKEFRDYALAVTERLRASSIQQAIKKGRPYISLSSSKIDKCALAKQIAKEDQIERGLIAIFGSVELCLSYRIAGNRKTKRLQIVKEPRKCLHLYHYSIHPEFGFMHARIQTWFPFNIQICLNGREWLSRELDRAGIKYLRHENCFPWIEDFSTAQKLMARQLRVNWLKRLNKIAATLNPVHNEIFQRFPMEYYWSSFSTEWATDISLNDPEFMRRLEKAMTFHGMATMQCEDVMRYMGKIPRCDSNVEMSISYKKRPEGTRIKNWAGTNSIKLYGKFENADFALLRAEITMNNPKAFKIYRHKENDPNSAYTWRPLRSGIADMPRRAQISQASNERYLDVFASVDVSMPLGKLFEKVSRPTLWNGKRVRALRPTSHEDLQLFRAVNQGQFAINGFRNRDLQSLLFSSSAQTTVEKRRRSSRVTRLIRLLRAHHLIRKVSRSHRYLLTDFGRDVISTILASQHITVEQLNQAVA